MAIAIQRSTLKLLCENYLKSKGLEDCQWTMEKNGLNYVANGKVKVVSYKKVFEGPVTVVCYNQVEKFKSRKDAIDKYYEGAVVCEGCESERYWHVFSDLMDGLLVATDGISHVEGVC